MGRESRVRESEESGKIRQHTERLAVQAEGHRGPGSWAPRWSCGHWGH